MTRHLLVSEPSSPVTIAKITFGSHLYGTSTPTSDIDIKEIVLPPPRDILLQREIPIVKIGRSKLPGEKNCPTDVDVERITLRGFLNLLVDGDTMALDMLFAPAQSLLTEPSSIWTILQTQKHNLLSRRVTKAITYCRDQTKKYGIKGSRMHAVRLLLEWFDAIAAQVGTGVRLMAVEPALRHFVAETANEHITVIEPQPPRSAYLWCCGKRVPFYATLADARVPFQRIFDAYGARTLLAERNQCIDWKAVSHAVRVGHETLELLRTGHITFPLPNASHIRDIKQGLLPYSVVADEVEQLMEFVSISELNSHLPDQPNIDWIESFITNVYAEHIRGSYY